MTSTKMDASAETDKTKTDKTKTDGLVPNGQAPAPSLPTKIAVKDLRFYYGDSLALKTINMPIYANKVTALIGPSGCGKSTLLRVLNRMYDLYPRQRAEGEVLLDGKNILEPGQDLNLLRARVGMVFQKPTPFPMSIFDNIAFGIKLYEKLPQSELAGRVETALRGAALWNEVKDKLSDSGLSLSGGQPAASLHRTHRRRAARGDPIRRAMLGVGPDLDREGRGADRRAHPAVHDRHRHAFDAAGGARLDLHPPSCISAS